MHDREAPTIASVTAGFFRPLVGESFRLDFGDGTVVDARLAEVSEGRPTGGTRRVPFLLILRTDPAPHRHHGSFRVSHPAFGCWQLSMSELAPDGDGCVWQIVFN